jgi:formylglycine-generating enzyme required for sulfatase activity
MVTVPGGITFPTGTADNGTATVAAAYEIGETEVSYELWHAVRLWAEGKGYSFYGNSGREGSSASSENTPPSGNRREPVTMVNWFDAVVWLNALTEWVNEKTGNTLMPVYYYDSAYATVAKDSDPSSNFVKESGSYNYASAYAKEGANGFRLPSSNEWELAARWRNDGTNTVSGYTNPWYTTGNSASGAAADYNNASATGAVAWYYDNITGTKKTQAVRGKTANGLGLYDMSGNVWEWCFDWYLSYIGSRRIIRGGSWAHDANPLRVGNVYFGYPDDRYNFFGFRSARTAQ